MLSARSNETAKSDGLFARMVVVKESMSKVHTGVFSIHRSEIISFGSGRKKIGMLIQKSRRCCLCLRHHEGQLALSTFLLHELALSMNQRFLTIQNSVISEIRLKKLVRFGMLFCDMKRLYHPIFASNPKSSDLFLDP